MDIHNDQKYFSHEEIEVTEQPSQQEGNNELLDEERVREAEEMLTALHFNAFWTFDSITSLMLKLAFEHIQITKFIVEAVHRRTHKPQVREFFDGKVANYNSMLYHSNVSGDNDSSLRARLMRKQTGLDNREKKFAQLQEELERRKLNLEIEEQKLKDKIEKERAWLENNKQFKLAFSEMGRKKKMLQAKIAPLLYACSPELMQSFNFKSKKGLNTFFSIMDMARVKVSTKMLRYVKANSTPEEYKVFEARALAFNANCPKAKIPNGIDVDDFDDVDEDETNLGCEYELINPFEEEDNQKRNEEQQKLLQQMEEKVRNLLEMQKNHEKTVSDFNQTKVIIMMLRKPLKAMIESGSPAVMDLFDLDDEMSVDWFLDICKELKCKISPEILNYVDAHYCTSVVEQIKEKVGS